MRPDAASMVWAREAISNPTALNASDPKTHSTARSSMEPRTGTWNTQAPNPSSTPTSTTSNSSRASTNDIR